MTKGSALAASASQAVARVVLKSMMIGCLRKGVDRVERERQTGKPRIGVKRIQADRGPTGGITLWNSMNEAA
jgi:hypothetical protein